MAPMIVRDDTLDALGSYLSRLTRRQEVVASNIANVDTPGYRTKDISFHATMSELVADHKAEVRGGRSGHLSVPPAMALVPEAFEVEGLTERADRNNVDIDREMLKLSQTSSGYGVAIQLLRAKFRTIAASIQEGRTA